VIETDYLSSESSKDKKNTPSHNITVREGRKRNACERRLIACFFYCILKSYVAENGISIEKLDDLWDQLNLIQIKLPDLCLNGITGIIILAVIASGDAAGRYYSAKQL
jgi:hypothetical protein